jgi:hypothetical protein
MWYLPVYDGNPIGQLITLNFLSIGHRSATKIIVSNACRDKPSAGVFFYVI